MDRRARIGPIFMSCIPIHLFARLRGVVVLLGLGLHVLPIPAWAEETKSDTTASTQVGLDPLARRYELGSGWALGKSGFTLGGYAEALYVDPAGEAWEAGVNALSALLWWEGKGRWRFFSEIEVERLLIASREDSLNEDQELVVERLYFDYAYADSVKLRLGKFLTPVGRWNLLHAPPLTWTTSRPLITEETFPTSASGAMVYGVLPWTTHGIEYSVYASPNEEIFREPGADTFSEAYGGRVAASPLPYTQLGVSFVSFELAESRDERKHLLSADLLWSWHRFEISGEYVRRSIDQREASVDEYGHYVQLVAPLGEKLYAVARYEGFRAAEAPRDLTLYLGGLNYRVRSGLVLKAEYSRATKDPLGVVDGLLMSIAVLF